MNNMNTYLQDAEFKLNHGGIDHAPLKAGSHIVRRKKLGFKGVYDFAVQGGAIGTHALYDPVFGKNAPLVLPANFIINDVLIDVVTAVTSAGAPTVALTSGQGAGDIMAAALKGALGIGLLDGVPIGSAATSIKIPSTQAAPGSTVSAVIAVAALTAGKIIVHIEGFLSDAL